MEILPHHIKNEVCLTRPTYREGKVHKTVKVSNHLFQAFVPNNSTYCILKVYTCTQESKYIIVTNIPSIGVNQQLLKLFAIYGTIEESNMLYEYPCASYSETMLFKFLKIKNARELYFLFMGIITYLIYC